MITRISLLPLKMTVFPFSKEKRERIGHSLSFWFLFQENISDFLVSDCMAAWRQLGKVEICYYCGALHQMESKKITGNSIYCNLKFKHIWWYIQKLCLSHSPGQKYVLFPAVPSFHAVMLPILLLKRIMYIIYLLHRSSFLWPLITFADVVPLLSVKARVIRFWRK